MGCRPHLKGGGEAGAFLLGLGQNRPACRREPAHFGLLTAGAFADQLEMGVLQRRRGGVMGRHAAFRKSQKTGFLGHRRLSATGGQGGELGGNALGFGDVMRLALGPGGPLPVR